VTAAETVEIRLDVLRRIDFERRWLKHHNRGRSSDALVEYVLHGGPAPAESQYPRDWWDLRRCIDAYDLAPVEIRSHMNETLERYARFVAENTASWTSTREAKARATEGFPS
jgi:hypothetical protein